MMELMGVFYYTPTLLYSVAVVSAVSNTSTCYVFGVVRCFMVGYIDFRKPYEVVGI